MAKNPDDIVPLLYGSSTRLKNCAAFCRYHHCHLTPKQILRKGCLGKQCKCLDRIEHGFWKMREQKKLKKKEVVMKVYIGITRTSSTLEGIRIDKVFLNKNKADNWKKESVARSLVEREVIE